MVSRALHEKIGGSPWQLLIFLAVAGAAEAKSAEAAVRNFAAGQFLNKVRAIQRLPTSWQ